MSDSKQQNAPRLQYLLVRKTTASHEYDPDHALDFWRVVAPWIPKESPWDGYGEADWKSDDDRIISLFELLEGSMLGDIIFGSLADDDGYCELVKRWDDWIRGSYMPDSNTDREPS